MTKKLTRRRFVHAAAPVAAGAAWLGQSTRSRGAPAKTGANEKLAVGFIGCGGRGRYLLNYFKENPDFRVVAVCDVNRQRAAEAREQAGEGVVAHEDFRKITEDPAIDAVVVATTGHWHVLPAIHACQAGKDVYLEKPVGTSIGEGRALIKAARDTGRIVHMGTQQRSWEHYIKAVELIRAGGLGEISDVHVYDLENFWPGFGSPPSGDPPPELNWDFYLGPSPEVAYNPNRYIRHYWFFDYGGAWQLDWAVHHYDIVHWAMQVSAPVAATAAGGEFSFFNDNTEWPDTFNGACEYAPGPVAKKGFLMSYSFRGGCNRPIEGRTHGKVFYGSDAAMVLDRTGAEIFTQRRDGKKIVEDRILKSHGEHDAVREHIRRFVACIRDRKRSPADIQLGHEASNPGHLMNIAWRVGRRVRWDSDNEKIIDDKEANRWVTKEYRKPWSLPV